MLTPQQLHQFNDEYITRYAHILSEGKRVEEMKRNHWRELSCFETGLKCFRIGGTYESNEVYLDGKKTHYIRKHILKIKGMFDETSFSCNIDGEDEVVEFDHDDESETIDYFPYEHGRLRIHFKAK